jgi:hypothetical protein
VTFAFCLDQSNNILFVSSSKSLHIAFAKLHINFDWLFEALSLHVSICFDDRIFYIDLLNFKFIVFHFFFQLYIKVSKVLQFLSKLLVFKHFAILLAEGLHLILVGLFFKINLLLDWLKWHIIVLKNKLLFPYCVFDLFMETRDVFL